MFYVVSYDIKNDKRRNKIFKLMKDYGKRVQYSVFECEFSNEKIKEEMKKRIKKLIKEDEDSVRIYFIPKDGKKKIEVIGQGEILEYRRVYII